MDITTTVYIRTKIIKVLDNFKGIFFKHEIVSFPWEKTDEISICLVFTSLLTKSIIFVYDSGPECFSQSYIPCQNGNIICIGTYLVRLKCNSTHYPLCWTLSVTLCRQCFPCLTCDLIVKGCPVWFPTINMDVISSLFHMWWNLHYPPP